jgi:hypothetical protein
MRITFPFHRLLITFALVFVAASSLEADDASSAPFPLSQVPETFKHPGLLNNLDELKRVRQKIEAGEEPWKTAFEKMKASKWAALDYVPHPVDVVSSDINGSNDHGAVAEYDDGVAAYSDALLWVLTDDERYAKKAVEILNAWSAVLQTHQGVNWYLQTGWAGSIFPESAELLRATYPGWKSEDIAQFSAMLNRAFLPLLHNRVSFGNREFSVISAMVAIGVFNNDKAAFYEGVCHWVSYVPCYLYFSSDGPEPRKPDYWMTSPSEDVLAKLDADLFPNGVGAWFSVKFKSPGEDFYIKSRPIGQVWSNPVVYVNGLCAETCRDFTHTECGFAAMISIPLKTPASPPSWSLITLSGSTAPSRRGCITAPSISWGSRRRLRLPTTTIIIGRESNFP